MAVLVPRRNRSFFDELMSDPFESFFGNPPVFGGPAAPRSVSTIMRTDIKQTDAGFELVIDLPGFSKEDVQASLKEGVLTITASTKAETSEEEPQGVWVRKERCSGQCSRSFYVGEDIEEAEIKAKFENGTLKVAVPKKVEQPKLEETRSISIEG